MYLNYMFYIYYNYNKYINKFCEFKNRQHVPIERFVSDLKSGKLIKIILKAYNDKYVVAVNGGGDLVMANQDNITPETVLTFIPHGLARDKVVIGTSNKYFISITDSGEYVLRANKAMVTPEAYFEIIPIHPDKLVLKNSKGYYVWLDNNTIIKGNGSSIVPQAMFTIVEVIE